MVSLPDSKPLNGTFWPQHEWEFEIRACPFLGREGFQALAGGCSLNIFGTRDAAERWIAEHRRACLAELIAEHRMLHPAPVTIVSGGRRLGRIRPELWGSYDALALTVTNQNMSILSAKARAAFPDAPDALIMVAREDVARR